MLHLKVTPAIKIQTKQLKSAYNNLNLVLTTYLFFSDKFDSPTQTGVYNGYLEQKEKKLLKST